MKNEIKEGDYIDAIDGTNRITGYGKKIENIPSAKQDFWLN